MSEESKTALLDNNTRDELNALAEKEGVSDPESYSTKEDLAEAIIAQRESGASADVAPESLQAQVDHPGQLTPDETLEETRERWFENTFGHLDGEQLEAARNVAEAQWRQEDEHNERMATGTYPSTEG